MAIVATLSAQQISTLQAYQAAGQLPEAYQYLRDIALSQGTADADAAALSQLKGSASSFF